MERLGTYWMFSIAGIVFVLVWGGALWLSAAVSEKREELRTNIEERNAIISRNDLAQTMRTLVRDTRDQRAELSAIATEPDVVAMIRVLEQAAASAGSSFVVENVAPGTFRVAARPADVLPAAVLSVRSEGSFAAVYGFLSLVETVPMIAVVDSANFERLESGAWRMRMQVRIASEAVGE